MYALYATNGTLFPIFMILVVTLIIVIPLLKGHLSHVTAISCQTGWH